MKFINDEISDETKPYVSKSKGISSLKVDKSIRALINKLSNHYVYSGYHICLNTSAYSKWWSALWWSGRISKPSEYHDLFWDKSG